MKKIEIYCTAGYAVACFALLLQVSSPVLAAHQGSNIRPVNTTSPATLDDSPGSYGYAGVVIELDAKGFYFKLVEEGSPAKQSGLQTNDRLESFKIDEPNAAIYKSLYKTITYNPNKTILVSISRAGTSMQIPLRLSSLQEFPNEELLKTKRKERKRDTQGIPYCGDVFDDAPEVPQVVEFFESRRGPSSILLQKRLDGLKVLSMPFDDARAHAIQHKLNLKIAPQVVSIDGYDGLVFPFPIGYDWQVNRDLFYSLDYAKPEPGEFAAIADEKSPPASEDLPETLSEQEIALRNSKFDGWPPIVHTGRGRIIFEQRGGHLGPSIIPVEPVAHTWFYHNQNNYNSSKNDKLNQDLQALVRQTVLSLNSSELDTKVAAAKLIGEAKLTGNSIKAGSEENPGLGKFQELDENRIEVRQLSDTCAVARVTHIAPGTESYFYLIDDSGWKISAIRTPLEERSFAPGYDIDEPSCDDNWNRREAERVRNLTAAKRASKDAIHNVRVRALRLSLMTDSEIKVWFDKHQAELNLVAKQSMADLDLGERSSSRIFHELPDEPSAEDLGGPDDLDWSLANRLKALELGGVHKLKEKNVYLTFASGRYSVSGVLFSEDDCPPPIGPYGTIWTEKLAEHWYLMRVIDDSQFPAI
ncbi:MAG: hypothetical protein WCT03_25995 [Candidatus Obscuribacterales bacterium]|jgi:hypothetical protein